MESNKSELGTKSLSAVWAKKHPVSLLVRGLGRTTAPSGTFAGAPKFPVQKADPKISADFRYGPRFGPHHRHPHAKLLCAAFRRNVLPDKKK